MPPREAESQAKSGPHHVEGKVVVPAGARFAIVASRFNHFIVDRLVEGALDALIRHGADAADVTVVHVPGAWEIPVVAQRIAGAKGAARVDAVLAIGAVIRGSTPHFDYVSAEVSKGVATASMQTGVPISFGVLTTDSIEQAIERAGTKAGNKGWDAAVTAIEMVSLARARSAKQGTDVGARHSGREAALQMLFQMEASGASAESVVGLFWRSFEAEPEGRTYADGALLGIEATVAEVDAHITKASTHWRLERMARVDRNVLRLGTWELMSRGDVPRAVILDEAVELAKAFGTEESSAFVNGVLNRIADDLGRRDGQP